MCTQAETTGGASLPGTADAGPGGSGREVPAAVQGHAWIALGKVCLVDDALAKKCVPLFVQVSARQLYVMTRLVLLVHTNSVLLE